MIGLLFSNSFFQPLVFSTVAGATGMYLYMVLMSMQRAKLIAVTVYC